MANDPPTADEESIPRSVDPDASPNVTEDDPYHAPNVDIASVRTVRCGECQVSVGRMTDDRYVATVTGFRQSPLGQMVAGVFGGDPEWSSVSDAPDVTRDAKFEAVGSAVEAFYEQDDAEGGS